MKKISGITLFELLIVVGIISITLVFAIPAYRIFIIHNQTQTNINRFISALHFARTQALLKKQSIFVCPYTAKLNCGSNWAEGLIIYNNKEILKIIDPFKNAIIIWNRKKNILEFAASGRLKNQNGKF